MAIYCQEHNKWTAHTINHECGNESVLLQQMNGRTEGEKKEEKTTTKHTHTNITNNPLYLFFCILKMQIIFSASMKNELQIWVLGKLQMQLNLETCTQHTHVLLKGITDWNTSYLCCPFKSCVCYKVLSSTRFFFSSAFHPVTGHA